MYFGKGTLLIQCVCAYNAMEEQFIHWVSELFLIIFISICMWGLFTSQRTVQAKCFIGLYFLPTLLMVTDTSKLN